MVEILTPPSVRPTGIDLQPDSSRAVTRLFLPGLDEYGSSGSRASSVINRLLGLSEEDCIDALEDVLDRFSTRHRNLEAVFNSNADRVLTLVDPELEISASRRTLIGACFTLEYTIEAAALCNPSIVLQRQVQEGDGSARFIMSVRGIGEGHRSTIGFRTGRISADGSVTVHAPSPYVIATAGTPGIHHRSVFQEKLDLFGDEFDNVCAFIGALPPTFDDSTLAEALTKLAGDPLAQRLDQTTLGHIHEISHWSYIVEFPEDSHISERVLWPHSPTENHGMEDARFVRFVDDDGQITYFATYTAVDRGSISLQLLETQDFRRFASTPMAGAAAEGKGLALFPRKIRGRYWALTRCDRETNGIASTEDIRHWPTSLPLQMPRESWELIQLGNCGSPIEIEEGWLVLTHGVGPMRTYSIGALLLDKENPERVLKRAADPILAPGSDRQNGYVPNVVYSSGGVVHRDTLVIPFGVGDQSISVATMSVRALLDFMVPAS